MCLHCLDSFPIKFMQLATELLKALFMYFTTYTNYSDANYNMKYLWVKMEGNFLYISFRKQGMGGPKPAALLYLDPQKLIKWMFMPPSADRIIFFSKLLEDLMV